VKLSGELRLTEAHIARLLKQIRPEIPKAAPTVRASRASSRARKAANTRWQVG